MNGQNVRLTYTIVHCRLRLLFVFKIADMYEHLTLQSRICLCIHANARTRIHHIFVKICACIYVVCSM